MSFLIDTHIALWAILDSPELPDAARAIVEDASIAVSVSAASVWEISIKHALGAKRSGPMLISGERALSRFIEADFEMLSISASHAAAADALPPHHADPFDRMIVAQAIAEGLVLVTRDRALSAYHPAIIVV